MPPIVATSALPGAGGEKEPQVPQGGVQLVVHDARLHHHPGDPPRESPGPSSSGTWPAGCRRAPAPGSPPGWTRRSRAPPAGPFVGIAHHGRHFLRRAGPHHHVGRVRVQPGFVDRVRLQVRLANGDIAFAHQGTQTRDVGIVKHRSCFLQYVHDSDIRQRLGSRLARFDGSSVRPGVIVRWRALHQHLAWAVPLHWRADDAALFQGVHQPRGTGVANLELRCRYDVEARCCVVTIAIASSRSSSAASAGASSASDPGLPGQRGCCTQVPFRERRGAPRLRARLGLPVPHDAAQLLVRHPAPWMRSSLGESGAMYRPSPRPGAFGTGRVEDHARVGLRGTANAIRARESWP